MSPSYHHAYIAGNLITAFNNLKKYSVFSELTLQIEGQDHIPDISLYPKRKVTFGSGDIIRMTEMPLMVVEILSPSQGSQEILDKFRIYFGAGIISCWLVVPVVRSVAVYSNMETSQIFYTGDIIDTVSDIHLSVESVFDSPYDD